MTTPMGVVGDCCGWEGRATVTNEAKGEEKKNNTDVDALHLHWHRRRYRCQATVCICIYVGANTDVERPFLHSASTLMLTPLLSGTDIDVKRQHLRRALPPFLLSHLSSSLSYLIHLQPPAIITIRHHRKCNWEIKIIFVSIIFMLPSIKLTMLG